MPYALSLLDKSPILRGEDAEVALARTVELARLAEHLGYRRFWVAEHHNTPDLASSSPEILLAHLAGRTSRIRLGSGGVMLQHYSPYKVAENFNLLSALAPGRVDVGIGKAPGGLPLSSRALQGAQDPARRPAFSLQLAELDAHLAGSDSADGLRATPLPKAKAERFLLGASVESAILAAELGWQFVFARHLNGDDAALAASVTSFRDTTHKTPVVAVAAIIADSSAEARAQADAITLFRVHIAGAQSVTVGSEAQAAEYARQAGVIDYTIEPRKPGILAGSARDVLDELDRLSALHGISEFIIDFANQGASRLEAVRLLAGAHASAPALAIPA